ncbi:hypothetical protein SUGI_0111020 [Cryptomeria japonica]|nr:hypothetical protein SUGI_0111020 [Cryptomeria japonica]
MVIISSCLLSLCILGVEGDRCKDQVQGLVNACKPIIYGQSPSPNCCSLIRSADTACVCPKVTPQIAALIQISKAVRIVEGCGRKVPHHFRCGSVVTP